MTAKTKTTPIDRLKEAYKRDPKKFALVAGLSVLMVILWGRNLFTGPNPVSAALVKPVSTLAPPPKPAVQSSPADVALLQWLDGPAPVVSKNLFGVDPRAFPKSAGSGNTGRNDNSDGGAKSDQAGTDEQKEQQAAEALRNDAAKWKLQSTVLGPHPLAVVNGQLVGVGDEIGAFKVEKIAARTVTLVHRNDGRDDGRGDPRGDRSGLVRIELNMD